MNPDVTSFFHNATSTYSHVVVDHESLQAAIIDPVLDYDAKSGCTQTDTADQIIQFFNDKGLSLIWILETHAHADHLSSAQYLKSKLGGKIAIGSGIQTVQKTFSGIFNIASEFSPDGSQFDHLFVEGEIFEIGRLKARVIDTPGHTNDSITYHIGNAAFIGDTLFGPDYGSARCDFPGGDARTLHQSVQKLFALPDNTRLYLCHDYPPENSRREPSASFMLSEQRSSNVHINSGTSEESFVQMRTTRDAGLEMPKLIIPAIQVNIRAGQMPEPESNGVSYLKIPLDTFCQER